MRNTQGHLYLTSCGLIKVILHKPNNIPHLPPPHTPVLKNSALIVHASILMWASFGKRVRPRCKAAVICVINLENVFYSM